MIDHTTIFKCLDGTRSTHGGEFTYTPGEWTPPIEDVRACRRGYHVATGVQVLDWLSADLWLAEVHSDHPLVDHGDKGVSGCIRIVERVDTWDETTARLFAADCAEMALLGERAQGREPDERSWAAVEVARRFARGEATEQERAAAWAAARAAAGAAARAAAWAAAWDAARAALWAAAWAAARAAAWDAAGAAAWDAAWAAARAALYDRLCLYLNGSDLPSVEALYGGDA